VPRVLFFDLCTDYNILITQITADDLRRELAD